MVVIFLSSQTRPATSYQGTVDVAKDMGVDYKNSSIDHMFAVKESIETRELSPHFGMVFCSLLFWFSISP